MAYVCRGWRRQEFWLWPKRKKHILRKELSHFGEGMESL